MTDDASANQGQTIAQLTERMQRMEDRMRQLEQNGGADLGSAGSPRGTWSNQASTPNSTTASRGNNNEAGDWESPATGCEVHGAKYRLTVDDSGDVRSPIKPSSTYETRKIEITEIFFCRWCITDSLAGAKARMPPHRQPRPAPPRCRCPD